MVRMEMGIVITIAGMGQHTIKHIVEIMDRQHPIHKIVNNIMHQVIRQIIQIQGLKHIREQALPTMVGKQQNILILFM